MSEPKYGKGSRNRVKNLTQYRTNYDLIFRKDKPKEENKNNLSKPEIKNN